MILVVIEAYILLSHPCVRRAEAPNVHPRTSLQTGGAVCLHAGPNILVETHVCCSDTSALGCQAHAGVSRTEDITGDVFVCRRLSKIMPEMSGRIQYVSIR